MMTGIGMGLGGISLLIMLLFWFGLIIGGVWLVKSIFSSNQPHQPTAPTGMQPSPRDILDQRYVRGELTRDQYEIMKEDLS